MARACTGFFSFSGVVVGAGDYSRNNWSNRMERGSNNLSFTVDASDFGRLSRHLKTLSPELRKELRWKINAACKPVVAEMRGYVMGLAIHGGGTAGAYGIGGSDGVATSVGSARSGNSIRSQHALRRAFSRSGYTALDRQRGEARVARALGNSGLRSSVAATIRIVQRDSASGATIAIRAEPSRMPPGQRLLPAHLNRGRWRHPTFGRPSSWVSQYAAPMGWFARPAERAKPHLTAVVGQIVSNIAQRAAQI